MRNLCLRVLHKQAVGIRIGCSPVLQRHTKPGKENNKLVLPWRWLTSCHRGHQEPTATVPAVLLQSYNCSRNTNKYVAGKKATGRKAKRFELEELYKFLELLIYNILVSPSSLVNYWKWNQSVPFPVSLMIRDRFWMNFFGTDAPVTKKKTKIMMQKQGQHNWLHRPKKFLLTIRPNTTPKRIWQ